MGETGAGSQARLFAICGKCTYCASVDAWKGNRVILCVLLSAMGTHVAPQQLLLLFWVDGFYGR